MDTGNTRRKPFTPVGYDELAIARDQGVYHFAIYTYLSLRMGRNASAWPSYDRIAEDLNISRATVIRTVPAMVDTGLVRKRRGVNGATNHYTVVDPPSGAWQQTEVTQCLTDTTPSVSQILKVDSLEVVHTTYGAEAPNPSSNDATGGDTRPASDEVTTPVRDGTKWFTPFVNEVYGAWAEYEPQGSRDRVVETVRLATSLRTVNGKTCPPAIGAALSLVYRLCFGTRIPPDSGRLLKLARERGGPERFAVVMLEAASKDIVGDPHDFLAKWGTWQKASNVSQSEAERNALGWANVIE
jgi:hypothetical protein